MRTQSARPYEGRHSRQMSITGATTTSESLPVRAPGAAPMQREPTWAVSWTLLRLGLGLGLGCLARLEFVVELGNGEGLRRRRGNRIECLIDAECRPHRPGRAYWWQR